MEASIQTLTRLFSDRVSYRIPVFQRPYAWTKERQWEPLWGDVREMARRHLEADPQAKVPPHFMGAIVLQLQSAVLGQAVRRIVVDGQQRLTTLQLLLRAAQTSFQALDDTERATRIARLTLNQEDQGSVTHDDTKVRQSNVNDLQSFQDVIRGISGDVGRPSRSIGEAYQFFTETITEWLNERPADRNARADALEATLTQNLQIAAVDLDEGEPPHFIFSVLNARAEPLKQSDHIKNTVMYRANVIDDAQKAAELWGIFENDWWRTPTNEGRLSRIHLDRFLNYWVVMQAGQDVNAESVFAEFNKFLASDERSIEEIAAAIRRAGLVYQDLEEARTPGIEAFLHRMKTMEVGVVMPILLWLYTTEIPEDVRKRSIRALESYLVRRMLYGYSTQGLNRLFVELLARLKSGTPQVADVAVIDFLSGQTVDNRMWPRDHHLFENLVGEPLRITIGRQTMVLEALELHLRTDKTEDLGHTTLTREHIMPQSWKENWPLPEGADSEEAKDARDQAVKEIGNLTLVTGKMNSSLSNEAWDKKKKHLEKHTALRLNWELLQQASGTWDEDAIRERSRKLAGIVAKIWPFERDEI